MEVKEWSQDPSEMTKLQSRISAFVVDIMLDGVIPHEVILEGTSTSPMTIANAVRQTIIKELTPPSEPEDVTDDEVAAHDIVSLEEVFNRR